MLNNSDFSYSKVMDHEADPLGKNIHSKVHDPEESVAKQ